MNTEFVTFFLGIAAHVYFKNKIRRVFGPYRAQALSRNKKY